MAVTAEQPPPLTYEDTARILARLQGLGNTIVLVGGQAVNFWATYFLSRVPALEDGAPYTSKDIDFSASHAAVRECAARLGGTPRLATLDDMNTPNTGTVVFVDSDGYKRTIDFLAAPAGLDADEVERTSFPAQILQDGVAAATFRVLHPVLSLRSRVHNVAYLSGYQTAHALNQLRAAISCAREYVREALDQGEVRVALNASEMNYGTALYRGGADVFVRHDIDAFDAVVIDARLPAKFNSERYPRMLANVQRSYKSAADAVQRGRDLEARRTAGTQRVG